MRVHLLTTGGTIEKRYVEQAGLMQNTEPQMEQCLLQLRLPSTEVVIETLMNKDSLFMTDADRAAIAQRTAELVRAGMPVLITHGTDTMVETGLAVAERVREVDMPIVFTGAMTPFGIQGSDAMQNLTEALLSCRLMKPGVYLAFHGEVFPIARVRKDLARSRFVAA